MSAINAKLRKQRAKNRKHRTDSRRRDKKDRAEQLNEELELAAQADEELQRREEALAPVSSWGLFAGALMPRDMLTACCCPCYYAQTRAIINNSNCCLEIIKCALCCPCVMAIWAPAERHTLRRNLSLEPECGIASGDRVVWWLCPLCAMCEEAREMRSRKCRSTAEYLKRVQESRVAEASKKERWNEASSRKEVEKSELVHRSSGWSQCEPCCFCAPDEVQRPSETGLVAGFEFTASEMPGWVTRSMEAPREGDPKPEEHTKWHFCPNCGQEVKDHRPGTKQFCMTCGNSL